MIYFPHLQNHYQLYWSLLSLSLWYYYHYHHIFIVIGLIIIIIISLYLYFLSLFLMIYTYILLFYLSIHLFINLFLYPFIYSSISLFIYSFISYFILPFLVMWRVWKLSIRFRLKADTVFIILLTFLLNLTHVDFPCCWCLWELLLNALINVFCLSFVVITIIYIFLQNSVCSYHFLIIFSTFRRSIFAMHSFCLKLPRLCLNFCLVYIFIVYF